jgi:hypothetical protein
VLFAVGVRRGGDFELSMAGVNSGYPRLAFLGAVGVAPSVVVAVDNP